MERWYGDGVALRVTRAALVVLLRIVQRAFASEITLAGRYAAAVQYRSGTNEH
jgi:hypothetical protein